MRAELLVISRFKATVSLRDQKSCAFASMGEIMVLRDGWPFSRAPDDLYERLVDRHVAGKDRILRT